MTTEGVDTIHRDLTGAILHGHGYSFACRYVVNAPTKGHLDKELTAAEVREKSAAGTRIVSNFEWDPSPINTVAEGRAHARAFLDSPAGTMGPDWAPCYYSVDVAARAHAYDSYAHGWADILGPERCGVYGDGSLYRQLKADGLISYAWESMSTSFPGNHDHTGADIIQIGSGTLAGFSCDFNTAVSSLYGGWLLGEDNPTMPTAAEIAAETVRQLMAVQIRNGVTPTSTAALRSFFTSMNPRINMLPAIFAAVKADAADDPSLDQIVAAIVTKLPAGQAGGITTAQVEQSVRDALAGATIVLAPTE